MFFEQVARKPRLIHQEYCEEKAWEGRRARRLEVGRMEQDREEVGEEDGEEDEEEDEEDEDELGRSGLGLLAEEEAGWFKK